MLTRLRIRHLAIIDDLVLSPGPGLNLLTGETGAGKSIIVDALALVTGGRAGADTVRAGEKAATVEATFESVPEAVTEWAARVGAEVEDGTLILRREAGADGRTRAFAGTAAVPVSALREVGELLVDLHGQHQAVTLLKPATHLDALDRFAALTPRRESVAARCAALRGATAALEVLKEGLDSRAERLERLRFEERELAAVEPREGEAAELNAERGRLAHAGRIASLAAGLVDLLSESEGAALERIARARAAAEELAGLDPAASGLLERLDEARFAVEDAAVAARPLQDVEADPARLEWIETRLARLETLGRRHSGTAQGGGIDLLPETLRRLRDEIALLDGGEESTSAATARVAEAARDYLEAAAALSEARHEAAGRLAAALERELEGLAFGRVRIEVALTRRFEEGSPADLAGQPMAVSPDGFDAAEILFSSNAGEPPRPLSRVASGGELARVLLALNVLLGEASADGGGAWAPTVIFDEVDSGVGGRTADAVGERLARIARARQVLCVTHLPQVASRGRLHWRVGKSEMNGRTRVSVEPLAAGERVEEIARMIAGRSVTDRARDHARDLLREAAAQASSAPSAPASRRRTRSRERFTHEAT